MKRKIPPKIKKELFICATANCWYKGICTHKAPHEHDGCDNKFCSIMKIQNCYCKRVSEDD